MSPSELEEYIKEWEHTCALMDIPFKPKDAIKFAEEGGVFDR